MRSILSFLSFLPVIALPQAGSLDNSFGVGGVYTKSVTNGVYNSSDIVIKPDNSIIELGYASDTIYLMGITSNGVLDASFGTNGVVTYSNVSFARSLFLQADGKILAATRTGSVGFGMIRLNANGSLDASFGNNGVVGTTVTTGNDYSWGIAEQPDNKIVLVGGSCAGGSVCTVIVARYDNFGTPDNSFGTNGIVTTTFAANAFQVQGMALQSDGKILVVASNGNFTIIRYNTNGSLDNSFGVNGVITTNGGTANAIKIQQDGKIVAVGSSTANGYNMVCRYDQMGTLDNTFGNSGIIKTLAGRANALTMQPDNKILVGGFTSAFNGSISAVRYNTDGSLDAGFGNGGITFTKINSAADIANSVYLQSDGKIIVGATSNAPGQSYFAVARYFSGLTIGIEENKRSGAIQVFPNPAKDIITIANGDNSDFIIINAYGMDIMTGHLDTYTNIDISKLSPGLYSMELKNKNRNDCVKFLKN